jgi:hypothetical protein
LSPLVTASSASVGTFRRGDNQPGIPPNFLLGPRIDLPQKHFAVAQICSRWQLSNYLDNGLRTRSTGPADRLDCVGSIRDRCVIDFLGWGSAGSLDCHPDDPAPWCSFIDHASGCVTEFAVPACCESPSSWARLGESVAGAFPRARRVISCLMSVHRQASPDYRTLLRFAASHV